MWLAEAAGNHVTKILPESARYERAKLASHHNLHIKLLSKKILGKHALQWKYFDKVVNNVT